MVTESKHHVPSGSDRTQDALTHELRRVLNLASLPSPASVENDRPCLNPDELPAPEPEDTSEFAMVTRLVQGGLIPDTSHAMSNTNSLRLWLIRHLGAQLNWLVDQDSNRLMGHPDADLPEVLSTWKRKSVPSHFKDLVRWSKRKGVRAIEFRNFDEYTNRLRYFDMERSLSIIELMGLIAEVERRLQGLPLANADQWRKPPAVAHIEDAQDTLPKKPAKPAKSQEEDGRNPLRQLSGPQLPASAQLDALKQPPRPEKIQVYRDSSVTQ